MLGIPILLFKEEEEGRVVSVKKKIKLNLPVLFNQKYQPVVKRKSTNVFPVYPLVNPVEKE